MMADNRHDRDWIPEMPGPFADELVAYIRHKRALGYAYTESMCYDLRAMGALFGEMGSDGRSITREMTDEWCSIKEGRKKTTLDRRRAVLSGFARYLRAKGWEDVVEVEMGGWSKGGFVPYIFSEEEASAVFSSARRILVGEGAGEAEHGFYVALCLCYTCGLRLGEAARLRVGDVGPGNGSLAVIGSKGGISRVVALSPTASSVVGDHIDMLADRDPHAWLLTAGRDLGPWRQAIRARWHHILDAAGIPPRPEGRQRIHDLRHTFCVRALERMAEGGRDVRAGLPQLSAHLGHSSIVSTEYYLRLAPASYRSVSDSAAAGLPDFYGRGGSHE